MASMMVSRSYGFVLLCFVVSVSSGCNWWDRTTPKERMALLKVEALPENTTVYVNDRFAGTARVLAIKPKAMKPGVKYITFKAPDHFPHDVRLELPAGETVITMKLRPIPP